MEKELSGHVEMFWKIDAHGFIGLLSVYFAVFAACVQGVFLSLIPRTDQDINGKMKQCICNL